jgi:hypothetical protein
MAKLTLDCTQAQFESLHDALARTRKSANNVIVDKAALQALLMDHSKIIAALKL